VLAGHLALKSTKFLVRKSQGKRLLGRPGHRTAEMENIEIGF
jgi:hypothetical protein